MSLFAFFVVALIVVIAYYHYLQGMFSATLSAIFAIVAAVLAVSYQEPLERLLSGGGLADYAAAITLAALFAAIYLVLRAIFDSLVPGNIRLPLWVDRIGAAAMGVVAGLFATGLLAVAAQTLPFGASIALYSQYDLGKDRSVTVPPVPGMRSNQRRDAKVVGELKTDPYSDEERHSLFPPVDRLLLWTVNHLSDGGSMAGTRTWSSIHPDYLEELFGQRLAIQPGAKRTMVNDEKTEQAKVLGVYLWENDKPLRQIDAETKAVRPLERSLPETVAVRSDEVLLVVRTAFAKTAADSDNLIRLSPSAVRLVVGEKNEKNYYPIGTLESNTLLANRLDDVILIDASKGQRGADWVYRLDDAAKSKMEVSEGQVKLGSSMPKGSFLEAKRLGRADLSTMTIQPRVELDKIPTGVEIQVLRKPEVLKTLNAPPATAG